MRNYRYVLTAAAMTMFAMPALAATTIKVTEGGEGGGPMTLVLDKSTIKAGETTFLVHNDAVTEEHEMVLVKLKSADQKIVVDAVRRRVDEKSLESLVR